MDQYYRSKIKLFLLMIDSIVRDSAKFNPLTYGGRPIGPPLSQRQISQKTIKC
jgi:hypothetical protein